MFCWCFPWSIGLTKEKFDLSQDYCVGYCWGAIFQPSKTQELCVGSSSKAEFIKAYTAAAGKVVWYLWNILKELGLKQKKPTLIYFDNEPALKIMNENTVPMDQNWTQHLVSRFFALQDWRLDGDIYMIHIPRNSNPSAMTAKLL